MGGGSAFKVVSSYVAGCIGEDNRPSDLSAIQIAKTPFFQAVRHATSPELKHRKKAHMIFMLNSAKPEK
jgi:hypothetical protein